MAVKRSTDLITSRSIPVLIVIQCSMLSALAVVLGQVLVVVPNIELISLTIFMSGALGGVGGGIVTALTTTLCFNYLNPLGPTILPVLLVQCFAWSLVAIGGAIFQNLFKENYDRAHLAIAGGLVTLQYQLWVNIAFFMVFTDHWTMKAVGVVLIAALPYSAIHIIWNIMIFHILGKPLLEIVGRQAKSTQSQL